MIPSQAREARLRSALCVSAVRFNQCSRVPCEKVVQLATAGPPPWEASYTPFQERLVPYPPDIYVSTDEARWDECPIFSDLTHRTLPLVHQPNGFIFELPIEIALILTAT